MSLTNDIIIIAAHSRVLQRQTDMYRLSPSQPALLWLARSSVEAGENGKSSYDPQRPHGHGEKTLVFGGQLIVTLGCAVANSRSDSFCRRQGNFSLVRGLLINCVRVCLPCCLVDEAVHCFIFQFAKRAEDIETDFSYAGEVQSSTLAVRLALGNQV